MKRVLSLDFLRGIAIIGVLLFHVLNIAFAVRVEEIGNALDGSGSVDFYWYILAPVLLVLGAFNGLFLMISTASNAISVHKQWERAMEKEIPKDGAFRSIFVSQLIRGALIWVFGYLSETILATLLGGYMEYLVDGVPFLPEEFGWQLIEGFYFYNILYTIGISIVLTSFIQLLYLKNSISRKNLSVFLLVVIVGCTAALPVVREIFHEFGISDNFSNNLLAAPWWEWVLRLVGAPILGRLTPLIPFFSCAAAGLLLAININAGAITPGFIRKAFYTGLLFVQASFVVGIAFGFDLGSRERVVFYQTFILGLEIMSLMLLFYLIDFRKKTRKDVFIKYTVWIRRFGVMTLTLWMLQYFMVFPVMLIEWITGWPVIEGGLVEPQLVIVLLLLFLMWHAILWTWEKAKFKGSFEWLTSLVLSGKRSSGDRMEIQGVLRNPEGLIQHVVQPTVDKKERGLIIANICFAAFYGLVIVLVATGAISL